MAQPNDDKQQIIELTAALRQLEQQAKKATEALEKLHNTGPKSGNGPKKGKGSGLSPEEIKADKIRTAQMSAMGLALGAVKSIAKAVKKFSDHFNKLSSDFVKSTRTTTFSTSKEGLYVQHSKRNTAERMNELYDQVIEMNKGNHVTVTDWMNTMKKINNEIKMFGSTVDDADNALKKYNQAILKAQQNAMQMAGISKGLAISESTDMSQGLQAVALQWLAENTFKNELPQKGGLSNAENQTYIINSDEYKQLYEQLQGLVLEGGNAGPYTSSGFEGWAYKKGLYTPGVEYSESALAQGRYDYLLDQWTTQKNYGTTGLAALVDDSKKQTMILNHIGGSLASFDEVEQVSAFSTADTLEEAKKEVGESKLTNEKLDEQIEQWAKQYNLTDKEKQILTDLYNQGFSLTALQNMLDANLNLDEVYNALQAFLDKGATIEQTEAQLALALAGFPSEIKLSIPKDAKVKLDAGSLANDLSTAFKQMNGSAVINEDTAAGGSAFLQLLADNGYLDQYTAMSVSRFGWTKSEVEKWYLDYVKQHGTAPVVNPELDAELSALDTPEKMLNYYKKNTLFTNKNTGVSNGNSTKISAGTSDNVTDITFTMPGGGADAALALRNNIISSVGLTGTVSSPLLESASESTGAQGTGNTFIFNLNGSVYGGDKRIPLEFARQMNDALVDYNKKKGT